MPLPQIPHRVNEIDTSLTVLATESGDELTQEDGGEIVLGITRTRSIYEFEFNRQLPEDTP